MAKIKLTAEQISRLIKNKSIEVANYNFIEISDDNLQFNCNGYIHSLSGASFEFSEHTKTDCNFIIEDIQKLICRHLNLEPKQVIPTCGENYDFRIRFSSGNEVKIVVIDRDKAIQNTKAFTDEIVSFPVDAPRIGMYKRLGNSCYYLRWVEEI